jgi:hypothetical protein
MMKFKKKFALFGVVMLLFICSSNISVARIELKPLITVSGKIESNFYRAELNEREVYTYAIRPGFKFNIVDEAKAKLKFYYTLDAWFYDDKDTVPEGTPKASSGDFIGHTGLLEGEYRVSDRTNLGLGASYHRTRDEGHSDQLSNIKDRRLYEVFRVTPRVKYAFDSEARYVAEGRYRYTKTAYDDEISPDSTEHRGILDFDYVWRPTMTFDLQYQHWNMYYDDALNQDYTSSDYQADEIRLFFLKQFKHFSVEAGVGYQMRRFDDARYDDLNEFVYSLTLDTGDLLTWGNRRTFITGDFQQAVNNIDGGDGYYLANRATLKGVHYFTQKLSGGILGAYQRSDYKRGFFNGRTDDWYDVQGKLAYEFARWLAVEAVGGYENRDSNIEGFDFANSYFALLLTSEIDVDKYFDSAR